MAKMIRCIEGHVFDASKGQCPICGWRASQPRESFSERLVKSLPRGEDIKQALAAQQPRFAQAIGNLVEAATEQSGPKLPDEAGRPAEASSNFDLIWLIVRSRTVWILIITAIGVAMLIRDVSGSDADRIENSRHFINVTGVLMVLIFVFGLKMFLRSNVSLFLLLAGFFLEYFWLGSSSFSSYLHFWRQVVPSESWQNGQSPFPGWLEPFMNYFFAAGMLEDTAKLMPVGVLLLIVWCIRSVPDVALPATAKAKLLSWIDLSRATTIVMIAFASAAAFVVYETLGQYVWFATDISVLGTYDQLSPMVRNLPVITVPADWDKTREYLAWSTAYWSGLSTMIPRTLELLSGHGAYAAIPAYFIALACRKRAILAIALVIFGFCVSSTLHSAWDAYGSALYAGTLATASMIVLLAVCVQAMALDERAGFVDQSTVFGQSILTGHMMPPFPRGSAPVAAAHPERPIFGTPPLPPQPTTLAIHKVGTLVVEGTFDVPARRIELAGEAGRVELASDCAFEINAHPTDPTRLGLKNVGARPWTLTTPDGRQVEVAAGKNAALLDKAMIDFGACRGRIELPSPPAGIRPSGSL